MKKISILSFVSATLMILSGCVNVDDSSSSLSSKPTSILPPFSSQTLLENLRADLSISGTLTKINLTNNVETNSNLKTFIGSGEFYLNETDKTSGENIVNLHYFKDEEGLLTTKKIDNNNEVVSVKMVDETSGDLVNFDDLIINPFSLLDADDFNVSRPDFKSVSVDMNKLTSDNIIASLITGYEFEINEMIIDLDDNYLPSTITLNSVSENESLTYQYVGNFTNKQQLNIEEIKPYEHSSDNDLLKEALEALKNQNYTLTLYSSAYSLEEPHSKLISTKIGYLVSSVGVSNTYGMIQEPNGGVAAVEVESNSLGDYLKGVEEINRDDSISNHLFNLDFSADLFKKTDTGYELIDGYEYLNLLLPECIYNMIYLYISSPLIFTIKEDLSKITYTYDFNFLNQGTIKAEITSIGTTVFPFDLLEQYEPYFMPKNWTEYDSDLKEECDALFGKDMNEVVPFYFPVEEGKYSYSGVWGNELQLEITTETQERADEIIAEYKELALDMGYTYNQELDQYENADGIILKIEVIDFFGQITVRFTFSIAE